MKQIKKISFIIIASVVIQTALLLCLDRYYFKNSYDFKINHENVINE